MLRRFGSAREALDALPRLARRGERAKTVTAVTRGAAEAELAALHHAGARLVCWGEPGYPSALAAIEDAPPILTVLGEAQLLQRPMIAVVGARNASANGRRLARDLAAELGLGGLVVISGLARGIDAAALGVVVVEAAARSGSLITAVCARAGTRGLCRTGVAARSARSGLQRPVAAWRELDRDRCGRAVATWTAVERRRVASPDPIDCDPGNTPSYSLSRERGRE